MKTYSTTYFSVEVSALTPGNIFPSSNSKEAPPPVDTCETLLVVPNFLQQVAVSPPPIMLTQELSATPARQNQCTSHAHDVVVILCFIILTLVGQTLMLHSCFRVVERTGSVYTNLHQRKNDCFVYSGQSSVNNWSPYAISYITPSVAFSCETTREAIASTILVLGKHQLCCL